MEPVDPHQVSLLYVYIQICVYVWELFFHYLQEIEFTGRVWRQEVEATLDLPADELQYMCGFLSRSLLAQASKVSRRGG